MEKSDSLILIRVRKMEFSIFSFACSMEDASMSIPSIMALGNRCASMRAISPVPVPTSNIWKSCPCSKQYTIRPDFHG